MTDFKLECRDWEVRAFLDGRKTMLRKPAWRPARKGEKTTEGDWFERYDPSPDRFRWKARHFKPTIWQSVKPGDRLWVRETHKQHPRVFLGLPSVPDVMYQDDEDYDICDGMGWRVVSSVAMPRWASRLTLIVTETKRERVQEITFIEARLEGIEYEKGYTDPRHALQRVWQSLHTKPGTRWEDNPEVVALSVTVHQQNIDALEKAA